MLYFILESFIFIMILYAIVFYFLTKENNTVSKANIEFLEKKLNKKN